MDLSLLHLHWTARKKQGKEYRVYSLARSIRSGSKIRKQIFFKLGKLTAREISQWRRLLQDLKQPNATIVSINEMTKNNLSSEDLQTLIKATAKKKFDYAEADCEADVELYENVAQQSFAEVIDPREEKNL
jgi:hypothetical protein